MDKQSSNTKHHIKLMLKIALPFCLATVFTLYKSTTGDAIYYNTHNIMFYGFCMLMLVAFIALAYLISVSFGRNEYEYLIDLDHKKD